MPTPTVAPRAWAWIACILLVSQIAPARLARAEEIASLPAPLAVGLSYNAAEREVFAKAETGELDIAQLFAAALVAGGVDSPDEIRAYEGRFRQLAQRLERRVAEAGDAAGDPAARAALVHAFVHNEILTGAYHLGCSRISQAMDTGAYNCVSATILFNVLAAEVGLETSANEASVHVLSVVRTARGPLHVETTCPRWFDLPGNKAPPGDGRPSSLPVAYRAIGVPGLVALVYYNLAVDLAEQRRFDEAIALNYKALRLDPGNLNARVNLLAAVNNWALELGQREQFAEAIGLLAHGRELAPAHRSFTINDAALRERWVGALLRQGEWALAETVLQQAAAEHPGHAYFAAARQEIELYKQSHEGDLAEPREAQGASLTE
jgi:tetratricopeptide (TPR) repeat protein